MTTSSRSLIAETPGSQLQCSGGPRARQSASYRLKVLVCDGAGVWLCTRRLQAGSFEWPRQASGSMQLSREQFDWLVADLPWQRLS
jgi:transposase